MYQTCFMNHNIWLKYKLQNFLKSQTNEVVTNLQEQKLKKN